MVSSRMRPLLNTDQTCMSIVVFVEVLAPVSDQVLTSNRRFCARTLVATNACIVIPDLVAWEFNASGTSQRNRLRRVMVSKCTGHATKGRRRLSLHCLLICHSG
jgi:hypothetical protein